MDTFCDLKQMLIALDWGDPHVMTSARDILLDYTLDQTKLLEQFPVQENETHSRYQICTVAGKFNLVLSVWKPNSSHPIQDHCGSQYLLKVLKGSLTDEHYTFDGNKSKGQRLEQISVVMLGLNDVYDEEDFKGYHKIFNQSPTEEAISLHLYRPPLGTCTVIDSANEEPELQMMSLAYPCRKYRTKKYVGIPYHKDNKHTSSQTALRIAATSLSLIALALALITMVICYSEVNGNITSQNFLPSSELQSVFRFCFKCALVGDYPDHHPKNNPLLEMLNNLTRHETDDHNSECCVENYDQFNAIVSFLSASLIAEQDVRLPTKMPHTTPVSAHKQLLPEQYSTEKKFGEHFPLTLNTSSHDPSYEHVRGVDVTTDGFIVKYTGLYFVYSSVQFKREKVTDKTLYHYVHRISFNNPMQTGVLLRSVYTICQDCPQSQETSFGGGIFYLQSGDKVQVCVSAPGVVDEQKEAMYMGLAMLNS